MLTVAEETLQELAAAHSKQVATHLYGQEINAETYALCKADLLLKGEGDAADNIVGGPEHSTLSNDAFPQGPFFQRQERDDVLEAQRSVGFDPHDSRQKRLIGELLWLRAFAQGKCPGQAPPRRQVAVRPRGHQPSEG